MSHHGKAPRLDYHRFEKREDGKRLWRLDDFSSELQSLGLAPQQFKAIQPGWVEEFQAGERGSRARAILYHHLGYALLEIYVFKS